MASRTDRTDAPDRGFAGFTRRGLVGFLGLAMALTPLGIDLLLPAFPEMRAEFGFPMGSTRISGFVTAYFVGVAAGQFVFGTASDRFGRRPVLLAGGTLYIIGAVLAVLAPTFAWLLASRVVWGFGAAASRVLALTIVRDRFTGSTISAVYSMVTAVFIVVPVVAPGLGAVAITFLDWRSLIALNVALALVLILLVMTRLEETLPPERRESRDIRSIGRATMRVMTDRRTSPALFSLAILFGTFASYLGTFEAVLEQTFGRPGAFPVLFGLLSLVSGVAAVANGRLVEPVGLDRMVLRALSAYLIAATLMVGAAVRWQGRPPILVWLALLGVVLFSHSTLVANLSTRVVAPMGDITGIASALAASMLIGGGGLIGAAIDRRFDGTVTPLSLAFLAVGITSLVLDRLTPRGVGDNGATVTTSP